MDPAAEGTTYPDVTFVVTPERVRAFADLFGGAPGVPPTFATVAEMAVFPRIVADPRLDLDLTRVLHGNQEYAFERAPREGETLTVRTRLASVRVRGGNGFLTIESDVVDGDDGLVVRCRSTMVERADP